MNKIISDLIEFKGKRVALITSLVMAVESFLENGHLIEDKESKVILYANPGDGFVSCVGDHVCLDTRELARFISLNLQNKTTRFAFIARPDYVMAEFRSIDRAIDWLNDSQSIY